MKEQIGELVATFIIQFQNDNDNENENDGMLQEEEKESSFKLKSNQRSRGQNDPQNFTEEGDSGGLEIEQNSNEFNQLGKFSDLSALTNDEMDIPYN